jgi:hypothetical protein
VVVALTESDAGDGVAQPTAHDVIARTAQAAFTTFISTYDSSGSNAFTVWVNAFSAG